ncbi:hypothetical protein HGRIS_006513 [Hohenbuehelia grisea]|uniref:Secreted protein n=1 Tax=Hohenbuehelia grisea TaxID=104357 RepID=A0ABR3J9U0_9AGAR
MLVIPSQMHITLAYLACASCARHASCSPVIIITCLRLVDASSDFPILGVARALTSPDHCGISPLSDTVLPTNFVDHRRTTPSLICDNERKALNGASAAV